MARHIVCKVEDLPVGGRRIIEAEGRSIGVFNVAGSFYAIRNVCPHQMAPLCAGKITGTTVPAKPGEYLWTQEGQIIRCPWHGWEFSILTGRSVFNPHQLRVRSYDVKVEPAGGAACGGETDAGCGKTDAEGVETFKVNVEDRCVVVYV